MWFYKDTGLTVPVIRSSVQLSFWTLCLCGSQESARPSFPGSWPWILNSLHASCTYRKQSHYFTVHQFKALKTMDAQCLFYYWDLKGSASPGWESFLLSVQLISLSCGGHTDGSQRCKPSIHCMGERTEVWVHSRAQTKHAVPERGKKRFKQYSLSRSREKIYIRDLKH